VGGIATVRRHNWALDPLHEARRPNSELDRFSVAELSFWVLYAATLEDVQRTSCFPRGVQPRSCISVSIHQLFSLSSINVPSTLISAFSTLQIHPSNHSLISGFLVVVRWILIAPVALAVEWLFQCSFAPSQVSCDWLRRRCGGIRIQLALSLARLIVS
jgi:hypothetical protein